MNEAQQLQEMQPLLYKQLQKSFEHGRLAHAYLLKEIQELENKNLAYGWRNMSFVRI